MEKESQNAQEHICVSNHNLRVQSPTFLSHSSVKSETLLLLNKNNVERTLSLKGKIT